MATRYGWVPSKPDQRDRKFSVAYERLMLLPPAADLRPVMPPVVDQKDIGSCTSNMLAAMIGYNQIQQKLPVVPVSRLFQYWNTRDLEGTVSSDAGASIRDTIKAANKYGFIPETMWQYDTARYTEKPPPECYAAANPNSITNYAAVEQTEAQLKGVLAGGEAVGFGFTVYQSFESPAVAQTGIVPMPRPDEASVGGHAVVLVAYDDATRLFLARNSWGLGWGLEGYFWIPYGYVLNKDLADDFWVIPSIPGGAPAPIVPVEPVPVPPLPVPPSRVRSGPTLTQVLKATDAAVRKVFKSHAPG